MISVERPLHAELMFHVLSHLQLGADAASLFRPGLPARPWVRGLGQAYLDAPGRLALHGLPLCTADLEQLLALLDRGGTAALADPAGQLLCGRTAAALVAEQARVTRRWQRSDASAVSRGDQWLAAVRSPLERLRTALWDHTGEPPPLRILDCEALSAGDRTHGRGMLHAGCQVVALSLSAPQGQALCQLLHEEIHSVTDGDLPARAGVQDTRVGSEGFARHRSQERRAVEAGQRLLERHAPQLLEDYDSWRKSQDNV